jgi:hypothetical protein
MALQRTRRPRFRSGRSLRSLGSPLNAQPLGTRRLRLAIAVAITIAAAACHEEGPTQPAAESLTGVWIGGLMRGCFADWSALTLTLVQDGDSVTGTIETRDRQIFGLNGTVHNGSGQLVIGLPLLSGECPVLNIRVTSVGRASFSSEMQGRCCGTIVETVRFMRHTGA